MVCELNEHNYQNPVPDGEGTTHQYYKITCTKCGDVKEV